MPTSTQRRRPGGLGALLRTAATSVAVVAVLVPTVVGASPGVVPAAAVGAMNAPAATVDIDGEPYPDPLRLDDGGLVTSTETWEGTRRGELLAAFRENVYGQSLPEPTAQSFDVSSTEIGDVTRKDVTITVTGPEGTGEFPLKLFVPNTGQTPRGTFLMIDHRGSVGDDPGSSSGYAPISTITGAGYAFAALDAKKIAPDDSGSYRDGVIDLFHPAGEDLPDDAGRAVSAWAWGASRAMDYLQTDPDIDPAKVAVIGHSRGGKASLWAGAQDTRFAAVITNNSGSTGTKLARRGDGDGGGETVARVNDSFPHWFPPTYKAYDDRVDELPVDQHQLLALVAPRRVVVGSATDDANADPRGEFLSYLAAAPVYALYGMADTGLPSTSWKPGTDTAYRGAGMSYHLRAGGHGLESADWDVYLDGDLFGP